MEQAKVIELLNQTLVTEYMQKLLNAKLNKLVLYPVFPITAAANLSSPQNFVMIEDLGKFLEIKKHDLN